MREFFKPYKKFFIFLSILSATIIILIYRILIPVKVLPIYTPSEINEELVDNSIRGIKKYHTMPNFSLINQNGDTITEKYYKDKIYITDFFFTTCLTICPLMTNSMGDLQNHFVDNEEVFLLSHTVTPEIDDVPKLKEYARKHKVIDEKWNLVTGNKEHIYDLARKFYMIAKVEDYNSLDLIHTENFTLIDKKGQIRGYYDGTSEIEVNTLIEDVSILLNEGKEINFFQQIFTK